MVGGRSGLHSNVCDSIDDCEGKAHQTAGGANGFGVVVGKEKSTVATSGIGISRQGILSVGQSCDALGKEGLTYRPTGYPTLHVVGVLFACER